MILLFSIPINVLEYQQYQEAGADDDGDFIEEDEEEIPE